MREERRGTVFLAALAGSVLAGAALGLLDSVWFIGRTSAELGHSERLSVVLLGLLVGLGAGLFGGVLAAPLVTVSRRLPRWLALPLALAALGSWLVDATLYRNLYPQAHLLAGLAALVLVTFAGGFAFRQLQSSRVAVTIVLVGVIAAGSGSILGPLLLGLGYRVRQPLSRESTLLARVTELWPGPALPTAPAGQCEFPSPMPVQSHGFAKGRSLLLITVDALRADIDGPPLNQALPKLAKRLEGATVFERTYAATTRTNTSVYSLFTGQWPHHVKLNYITVDADDTLRQLQPSDPILLNPNTWRLRHKVPINDTTPTLAELLTHAGYQTGTSIPYVFFRPAAGITRGFEEVDIDPYRQGNYNNDGITSELLTNSALTRFDQLDRNRPWFFWIHYMDPHAPYHPYGDVSESAPAKVRYLSEFRRVDDSLDSLFEGLAKRGLLDQTVLVVTADHGEEFGEHGGEYHGTSVFEEQTRVPLYFKLPGSASRRVLQPVSLVDVMPTVLDLLGISSELSFDGRSLWELMRGGHVSSRPVLSLSTLNGRRAALVDGQLKLIVDLGDRTLALFDLAHDPREHHNLADERPEDVRRLFCIMQASGILEFEE